VENRTPLTAKIKPDYLAALALFQRFNFRQKEKKSIIIFRFFPSNHSLARRIDTAEIYK